MMIWLRPPRAISFVYLTLRTMRELLLLIALLISSGVTQAGAYDEIISAAGNNDTATVQELLGRGMDVNTADREGTTLLMTAARNGNIKMMKTLLSSRANVNRRNQFGDSALLIAALNGKTEAVKLLVSHKAEINTSGWAPLHYAVFGGSAEITALLIASGADLNARAPNGETALILAVKGNRLDLVQQLVSAKADKDLVDAEGRTAWQLADQRKFKEIANYLQTQGSVR
ncbi:MAG: ankyrin repeat domain-containing protein [Sulfuritalea sp.]|nr:ankyrin repeat domain-containing protein [Sulfuritalea sp.]